MNASWLTWQSKGTPFLDVAEKCPYCAEGLQAEKKAVIQQVAVEYDSKYVAELQKMIGVFQALENYFTDSVKETIARLSNSSTTISKEEINFLKEIKNQVVVLNNKLIEIKSLNFGTLKDVGVVIVALQGKRIDQQKNLIRKTIEKYHQEINGFLESAGYNYQVSIIEDQDKITYRMVLLSKENSAQVNDVKLHLSFCHRKLRNHCGYGVFYGTPRGI